MALQSKIADDLQSLVFALTKHQVPVVQRMDRAIHQRNYHPADK